VRYSPDWRYRHLIELLADIELALGRELQGEEDQAACDTPGSKAQVLPTSILALTARPVKRRRVVRNATGQKSTKGDRR